MQAKAEKRNVGGGICGFYAVGFEMLKLQIYFQPTDDYSCVGCVQNKNKSSLKCISNNIQRSQSKLC
jgi:hypothetical protein